MVPTTKKKIPSMFTMKISRLNLMSLIKKQMSSKPSKNMSKIPTLKPTTCTPLKFKMYSKYIARASQKDSNHLNNCQTESYSGTVPELLTTLVFYHKVIQQFLSLLKSLFYRLDYLLRLHDFWQIKKITNFRSIKMCNVAHQNI